MDSQSARKSNVFIAGFKNFELFYIPAQQQIVSQFRLEKNYPWQAPVNETAQETPVEGPDENLR